MIFGELSECKKKLLERRVSGNAEAAKAAKAIVEDVRVRGDEAVRAYAKKFDGVELGELKVTQAEFSEALAQIDAGLLAALKDAAKNIEAFCLEEKTRIAGWRKGAVGKEVRAIGCVGVYAPGGKANYPSSVLMGVVPARVAGVKRIVLCTPCNREGKCNPAVLAAASVAGATEVYKVGGAQAIAAMAFGTQSVPKAEKIVGPGNAFVNAAKLLVQAQGIAAIDCPAGPSEVLVIADGSANPEFIAAEMLAQAEHDEDAKAIAVCTSKQMAERVAEFVESGAKNAARKEIIAKALENAAVLFGALDDAVAFSNDFAPEHLVLMVEEPEEVLKRVENAGAVFLGSCSPVAAGDYAAGTNHVLPTGGTAKAYSGLSVRGFLKEIEVVALSKEGLAELKPLIAAIGSAEGLLEHVKSVEKRFETQGDCSEGC